MSGRGGWARLNVMALLLGLWRVPGWPQEQPPELEAIHKRVLQLYQAGGYAEAVPIAEEYIRAARAKFGEQHTLYASGLGALGTLYQALNRTSEAESLFMHAVEIKQKALGPTHPQVADALHTLAEFYRNHGRYAQAVPLYKRALSIVEKELGPEHATTGIVLGNLAELYRLQGRHAEAEPLAKRSAAIRGRSHALLSPRE